MQFTFVSDNNNNNNKENRYIQAVTLNGEAYTKTYITHKQIMAGGELVNNLNSILNIKLRNTEMCKIWIKNIE